MAFDFTTLQHTRQISIKYKFGSYKHIAVSKIVIRSELNTKHKDGIVGVF